MTNRVSILVLDDETIAMASALEWLALKAFSKSAKKLRQGFIFVQVHGNGNNTVHDASPRGDHSRAIQVIIGGHLVKSAGGVKAQFSKCLLALATLSILFAVVCVSSAEPPFIRIGGEVESMHELDLGSISGSDVVSTEFVVGNANDSSIEVSVRWNKSWLHSGFFPKIGGKMRALRSVSLYSGEQVPFGIFVQPGELLADGAYNAQVVIYAQDYPKKGLATFQVKCLKDSSSDGDQNASKPLTLWLLPTIREQHILILGVVVWVVIFITCLFKLIDSSDTRKLAKLGTRLTAETALAVGIYFAFAYAGSDTWSLPPSSNTAAILYVLLVALAVWGIGWHRSSDARLEMVFILASIIVFPSLGLVASEIGLNRFSVVAVLGLLVGLPVGILVQVRTWK